MNLSFCHKTCLTVAGFIIYRIRIRRGGRKRPAPKGQVYGKPKSVGINQLKNQRSLQAVAEVSFYLHWLNAELKSNDVGLFLLGLTCFPWTELEMPSECEFYWVCIYAVFV